MPLNQRAEPAGMSDFLQHECGIAMLRLKQPLQYYIDKYGSAFYGLNKMYLLMEKQHNRGQDGAGLANIKLDVPPASVTSPAFAQWTRGPSKTFSAASCHGSKG